MQYRRLGRSDLRVSEISLGSWLTFGSTVEYEQGERSVWRALDLGINLLDTANVYGRGAAEEFLGEVLHGIDRSSYLLASKLYFPMSPTDKGLSAQQVHKQSDASLKRLRTDYLDLYQCHRYDPETPLEETMSALTHCVRSGKVRYIGFSNWTAEQIAAALEVPEVERFVSSQPEYSILWRQAEKEVIPLCTEEGITQLAYSPLAQGVLTGTYQPGSPPPEGSRASDESLSRFMSRKTTKEVLEAVDRLRPIADELSLSMAQLALAWVLREPNVASAIVGATRSEQVEENAAAAGVRLSAETLEAIDDAMGDVVG